MFRFAKSLVVVMGLTLLLGEFTLQSQEVNFKEITKKFVYFEDCSSPISGFRWWFDPKGKCIVKDGTWELSGTYIRSPGHQIGLGELEIRLRFEDKITKAWLGIFDPRGKNDLAFIIDNGKAKVMAADRGQVFSKEFEHDFSKWHIYRIIRNLSQVKFYIDETEVAIFDKVQAVAFNSIKIDPADGKVEIDFIKFRETGWPLLTFKSYKVISYPEFGYYYDVACSDIFVGEGVYAKDYIWVVSNRPKGALVRIDPKTEKMKAYELGVSHPRALCFDGSYLWIGAFESPAKYLKFDPQKGKIIKRFVCQEADSFIFSVYDGKNIWFSAHTGKGGYVKVNPKDGAYKFYPLKEGKGSGLCFDGKNIWLSLADTPAKYGKIDPENGSIKIFEGPSKWYHGTDALYDGKYVWIGYYNYNHYYSPDRERTPAALLRINPEDGSYREFEAYEMEDHIVLCMTFDGKYLWVGLETYPARCLKIEPETMAYTSFSFFENMLALGSAVFDGKYVWFGALNPLPYFIKIEP